jgi:hypothetical protein
MEAKLSPILEAAKDILKSAKMAGMHVDAIAEQAVMNNKNLSLSVDDFSKKLQSALAANLKLRTQKPTFARVEGKNGKYRKGYYRLRREKTTTVASQVEAPVPEKAFTGKAGELAVMSELLFWGYNVSAMIVDSGIDVVANKDNKYFHIQVKTSSEQEGGKFYFTIKNSSFTHNHSSMMYYVFVLRRKLTNEFIIIPSSHLQLWISSGKVSSSSNLSITIAVDEKRKKYTLNNSVNIDLYYGNFGKIII